MKIGHYEQFLNKNNAILNRIICTFLAATATIYLDNDAPPEYANRENSRSSSGSSSRDSINISKIHYR